MLSIGLKEKIKEDHPSLDKYSTELKNLIANAYYASQQEDASHTPPHQLKVYQRIVERLPLVCKELEEIIQEKLDLFQSMEYCIVCEYKYGIKNALNIKGVKLRLKRLLSKPVIEEIKGLYKEL